MFLRGQGNKTQSHELAQSQADYWLVFCFLVCFFVTIFSYRPTTNSENGESNIKTWQVMKT